MAETRTRAEHVTWCQQRARAYLDKGEYGNAVASLMSDMAETRRDQVRTGEPAFVYRAVLRNGRLV